MRRRGELANRTASRERCVRATLHPTALEAVDWQLTHRKRGSLSLTALSAMRQYPIAPTYTLEVVDGLRRRPAICSGMRITVWINLEVWAKGGLSQIFFVPALITQMKFKWKNQLKASISHFTYFALLFFH